MTLPLTTHATIRLQQRGIPPWFVDLLVRHGDPRDLAHNFVLAHPRCNRSKSDTLAAKQHLECWLERLRRQADAIAEVAYAAGVGDDTGTTLAVACWAYGNAASSGAHAWQAPRRFEVVDVSYLELLASP